MLTMVLDKIRGQAKHAAWYNDPDEPPNYNPFGKVRTGHAARKNILRNAENGDSDLTRSFTDQEHQHAGVLSRQAELGMTGGARPRHATAPISDRSHTKPSKENASASFEINRTISPEPEELSLEKDCLSPLEETKDATSGDTITAEDTVISEKPRQRKGLKGMFHREKKVADRKEAEEDDSEKPRYTFGNQIKATLFNSWINILLLAG